MLWPSLHNRLKLLHPVVTSLPCAGIEKENAQGFLTSFNLIVFNERNLSKIEHP